MIKKGGGRNNHHILRNQFYSRRFYEIFSLSEFEPSMLDLLIIISIEQNGVNWRSQ